MLRTWVIGLLSIAVVACSDNLESESGTAFNDGITSTPNTGEGTDSFDQIQLLTDLTQHVFIAEITAFGAQAQQQIIDVTAMCDALVSEQQQDAALAQIAKQQWRNTMNQWQQIEVMQVGPLLDNDSSIKNAIYSWPSTNNCAVDQDVGYFEDGEVAGSAYDITRRTSTRRGLDALEYILFNDDLAHSCSKDSLAPDNWNARQEIERQVARCNFAVEVANDISNSVTELLAEWQNEGGFATTLTSFEQNTVFETQTDAVNHVTDAMFYVSKITKDSKLAAPIGLLANDCGTASCLDAVESSLSENSLANVKNNLIGLQKLFIAGSADNTGFDDFLVAVDAADLATTMSQDIETAIATIEAFEGGFNDAVLNQPEKVQQVHQSVKAVTDNLKSLFITYLSLELPDTSAGDAD